MDNIIVDDDGDEGQAARTTDPLLGAAEANALPRARPPELANLVPIATEGDYLSSISDDWLLIIPPPTNDAGFDRWVALLLLSSHSACLALSQHSRI